MDDVLFGRNKFANYFKNRDFLITHDVMIRIYLTQRSGVVVIVLSQQKSYSNSYFGNSIDEFVEKRVIKKV